MSENNNEKVSGTQWCILIAVILIVIGWISGAGDDDSDTGTTGGNSPSQEIDFSDDSSFSVADCAGAWDYMTPSEQAMWAPYSDFLDICTEPFMKDVVCAADPSIPQCRD